MARVQLIETLPQVNAYGGTFKARVEVLHASGFFGRSSQTYAVVELCCGGKWVETRMSPSDLRRMAALLEQAAQRVEQIDEARKITVHMAKE